MSKTWRCFHCDMNFANPTLAADHFGPSIHSDPVCKIDAKRIREMEAELARYREEDTDLHRQIHGLNCEHQQALKREEEKGYARGLRDGVKAHCAVFRMEITPGDRYDLRELQELGPLVEGEYLLHAIPVEAEVDA